ncbi:MAG TPA: TRAP transporter fused permease subunit [Methylomirabilota bacterium]|nr:TRAP transporter fused permease subunit [Methylomirabilota bacterium]
MTDAPPVERSAVDWLLGRGRGPQRGIAFVIVVLSVGLGLFHFYSTLFGQAEGHTHRSTSLALMSLLAFLVFPLGRKSFADSLTWHFAIDLAAMAIVLGAQVWTLLHIDRFVDPGYTATTADVVIGTLLILAVLEGTRRTVGWGLTLTAVFFILQTLHADWFFWIFYGPPTPWRTMVESFFGKEEGLYGIPTAIMSSVLILFILFSAFLATTGIGEFFVRLATALAGRLTGGPAKVSVFSSAFLGTISGSGVANVLMDGVFTIPMMKRAGYRATFAAAVEATASIGGQIMPPIMAAAAFIMADFVGVPFRQVALAAAIPAILYFFCVFMTVHFEARRLGLRKVPREEMPSLPGTLRQDGYLLLPIVALLWYLYQGFTEETAGLMAIATTFLVSFVRRRSRLGPERLLRAFETGARASVTVAMAVAAAGLIIGCVFLSGIGMQFSFVLIKLSGGELWLALVYTAFAAFILGLSLPTTAVYLTLAIIVAPGLVQMGVPKMAAHMFILYMGVTSDLTPPTCLSPFAAAGIAGSPPMATAWQAMRLGAVLYIVPFMFVYSPALLAMGSLPDIVLATLTAALGIFCLAAGLQGWLRRAATPVERALLLGAAAALISPSLYTDMAGIGLLVAALALQMSRRPREPVHAVGAQVD